MERSPMGCVYFHKGQQKWVVRVIYNKKRHWLGSFNTKEEAWVVLDEFRRTHRPHQKKKHDMFRLVPDKVFEFNVGDLCNYYDCICHNDWAHFSSIYGDDEEIFYPDKKTMAGGRRLA